MKNKELEYFIEALKSLPTISNKSAKKIAYFFLENDEYFYNNFIDRLVKFKTKTKFCNQCNNLTEDSLFCDICKNIDRDRNKLCIVTQIESLEKIEESNSYSGLYYVLKNEINHKNLKSAKQIPLDGIDNIINKNHIREVLLATDMTINGELTANFIKKHLIEKKYNLDIYRLALGIPLNSSIDYID